MKRYIKSEIYLEYPYKIRAYYDYKFWGLADVREASTLDEAIDIVHEFCSHGLYVEIQNVQTGKKMVFTPDEWMETIDIGDVPEEIKHI